MKILVTGGAGYLGYSLVRALSELEHVSEIVVYDNLSNTGYGFFLGNEKLKKVRFEKGDLLDAPKLRKAVKGCHKVLHLAAQVAFPYSYQDNHKYEQVNQFGTLSLCEAIAGSEVRDVIYLSSAAVYGFSENCTEDQEPNPANAYGRTKLEGEKYLNAICPNTNNYILRAGNVYGYNPCLRLDAVINRFYLDALVNKKILIYGNGHQNRPFISLSLLTSRVMEVVEGVKKQGIYNLVEFNYALNDIRDFLLSQLPGLEFNHINTSTTFGSLSMSSNFYELGSGEESDMSKEWSNFRNNYRLA